MTIKPHVIVDVEGTELTQEDREFLSSPTIYGVILFTRNYESPAQLQALTSAIKSINPNLLIVTDQEGGRVQRFRDGFTELNSMSSFGQQYNDNPELAKKALIQQLHTNFNELKRAGVDATLMPVVDLNYGINWVTGCRSFSKSAETVTILADIVIDEMARVGMPATLKHFPGHGHVTADSHKELPIDDRSFEVLFNHDMLPFRKLHSKATFVMPAHIIYTQIDSLPACFSAKWIKDILRKQLGFKGLVMTDDLSMGGAAEYGDYRTRAETAIEAGCDILLACNNRSGAIEAVECAVAHLG